MNIHLQILALSLAASLSLIMSGCETVQSIDAPRTHMTVRQARASLVKALADVRKNDTENFGPVREVKFTRTKCTFSFLSEPPATTYFIVFALQKNVKVAIYSKAELASNFYYDVRSDGFSGFWGFNNENAARMFADALLALRDAALAPDTEEADFAAFATRAKTASRPEMSDEVRTYKAVAEDAFKRKDFTAALDAYCAALDKYPLWPDGQYNAALLAAEGEDYELAARHMRRYLALAPAAKDAAAAKDKFLLWKHLEKQ